MGKISQVGPPDLDYPESDGTPMADNTEQWDWMVKLVGELRDLFQGQEVFVAGNLFWYPVEGHPEIVMAPDGMVVFGRPAGPRRSYKQWLEGGIAPQVVFEVLSESNTEAELAKKLEFYERYGVQEYYIIDPETKRAEGYVRDEEQDGLIRIVEMRGHVSELLKIRFEWDEGELGELRIYRPDGREFQSREEWSEGVLAELAELRDLLESERKRAEAERKRAEAERQRAEDQRRQAEAERQRAERLEAELQRLRERLKSLGLNGENGHGEN